MKAEFDLLRKTVSALEADPSNAHLYLVCIRLVAEMGKSAANDAVVDALKDKAISNLPILVDAGVRLDMMAHHAGDHMAILGQHLENLASRKAPIPTAMANVMKGGPNS